MKFSYCRILAIVLSLAVVAPMVVGQQKPAPAPAQQKPKTPAPAQQLAPLPAGTTGLHGQVFDQTGAVIPGANVALLGGDGSKEAKANDFGQYSFRGITPGTYTVTAFAEGFATLQVSSVELVVNQDKTLDLNLLVAAAKEVVKVEETNLSALSVDSTSNVGAIVMKGTDLEALSDDPDDLQADLQALAGPAAGPNGGQIYIDGFTGGRMPPKESIREIRINSNPFSAEYDRLGFGRIEILTKPGTDKYRGSVSFNYGNNIFNARNPYSTSGKPDASHKQYGGNFGGPIGKKASFFMDFERRDTTEAALINGSVLDCPVCPGSPGGTTFAILPYNQSLPTPTERTSLSPRVDYQINKNNTLVARYSYSWNSSNDNGIGGFSLPSQLYGSTGNEHTVQITETALLNARTVNETRYQMIRQRTDQSGGTGNPTISVASAFNGGGAGIGTGYTDTTRHEISNFTSFTRGKHFIKVGARLRTVNEDNFTQSGYNGSFSFTSIYSYLITQQDTLPANQGGKGMTVTASRADCRPFTLSDGTSRIYCGGPSQFNITAGQSLAGVSQFDLGLFIQDEWRLRQNFSLSLGGRYETQDNISDHADFAPRVAFAWGLGTSARSRSPKTVIRGGFGLFYDRFNESYTLTALRNNGVNQLQYLVNWQPPAGQPLPADFYPNLPAISSLTATQSTIRQIYSGLRSPYMAQSVATVERQLPKNTTLSVNYTNTRGLHTLRSRNINAPVPVTGIRPYPSLGLVDQYEDSGSFRQNQITTNVNTRFNSKISMFGFYTYGRAFSNTDNANTFPANQYDESSEWGRASFNRRHQAIISGTINAPKGIRLSPFIQMNSGTPFNIVAGQDLNGDGIVNDRPAFATASTVNPKATIYGTFDLNQKGLNPIPRNYATGPGNFTINLRIGKTWGIGERSAAQRAQQSPDGGDDPAAQQRRAGMMGGRPGGPGGPGGGGPGGPGGGGPRGGGGFGGGGPRGGGGGGFDGGGAGGSGRYNITLSANVRNLFNHVNPGTPVGNLLAPNFGESLGLGGGGFGGGATANRRVDLSLRVSF